MRGWLIPSNPVGRQNQHIRTPLLLPSLQPCDRHTRRRTRGTQGGSSLEGVGDQLHHGLVERLAVIRHVEGVHHRASLRVHLCTAVSLH